MIHPTEDERLLSPDEIREGMRLAMAKAGRRGKVILFGGYPPIAIAQSSVGVPRECLVEAHRRRGRSAGQQRLRRPARLWWAR
jgi:hypothetical protein